MSSAQPPSGADEALPGDAPAPSSGTDRYRPAADPSDGRDEILDRHVKLRRADPAGAEALEQEARFIARLDHGAIPTVYDFVRTPDGGAMLATRRVVGITLAEAIADARAGAPPPELAGAVPALRLLARVCDALEAAHARGIVHRQLAPAYITLALHGEVLVDGWSAAQQRRQRPQTVRWTGGTPPPPSQLDDQHIDLRAIGTCLFEALVLRPPTAGAEDPFADVTPAEGVRLSERICALVRRALRSGGGSGFRNMAELRLALEECAAEELTAVRVSATRRWRRQRGRAWQATAAVLLAAAVAAGWWAASRQRGGGEWNLVVAETFEDDVWRTRWSGAGAWVVRDGMLISTAKDSARLNLRQRLHVPVAIEYTGRMLLGQRPGDLSVVWSEGGAEGQGTQGQKAAGARSFSIQAASNDNSYFGIFEQPGYRRLAHNPLQLEQGRDYRFRVEIDGERIAMLVDGKLVLEHRDSFPSTSGYISLLGWHPGKGFDDVRIYSRPPEATVPAAAMGDALYNYGHYDDAASLYGRLAEVGDRESPLVQQVLFKKGMAERRAGRTGDSNATWSDLTDPTLAETADALRLEDLFATGQRDLFLERLRSYWRRSTRAHRELRLQWATVASKVAEARSIDRPFAEALLALRKEVFPTDAITGYEAARLLLRLDRNEEMLREFPGERLHAVAALMALGRLDDLDKLPWVGQYDQVQMCFSRGDFQGVIDNQDPGSYQRAVAMCKSGRAADIQGTFARHPGLLHLGRAAELLQVKDLNPVAVNECLIALDRIAEAAGTGDPDHPGSGNDWRAHAMLGHVAEAEAVDGQPIPWLRLLAALEAGDAAAAAAARAEVKPPPSFRYGWFPGMVIGPFADRLAGKPAALDESLAVMAKGWKQVHGQRAWRFARGALGEVGEAEVVGMPAVSEGRAWWLVASGLLAERGDRPAEARAAYAAFVALPGHQRLLEDNSVSAPVECFVRWRLRALTR